MKQCFVIKDLNTGNSHILDVVEKDGYIYVDIPVDDCPDVISYVYQEKPKFIATTE